VEECVAVLRGTGPADLRELCLELAAWMFVLGGRVHDVHAGKELTAKLIDTGEALRTFRKMVELQGGDAAVLDEPKLPRALHQVQVLAPNAGYVAAIQCEQ